MKVELNSSQANPVVVVPADLEPLVELVIRGDLNRLAPAA